MALELLKYLLSSAVVSTIITLTYTSIKETRAKKSGIQKAVNFLLCDQIKTKCKEYIREGNISFEDLELIKEEFTQYKAMGGNGYIDSLMARVDKLDIVED